jgi:hypothetical protein
MIFVNTNYFFNPVKQGYVEWPEYWRKDSAGNIKLGKTGLL